jgi:hypothetical protein
MHGIRCLKYARPPLSSFLVTAFRSASFRNYVFLIDSARLLLARPSRRQSFNCRTTLDTSLVSLAPRLGNLYRGSSRPSGQARYLCALHNVIAVFRTMLYRPNQCAVPPAVMACLVIHSIESMANMMKLGIRFDLNLQEA